MKNKMKNMLWILIMGVLVSLQGAPIFSPNELDTVNGFIDFDSISSHPNVTFQNFDGFFNASSHQASTTFPERVGGNTLLAQSGGGSFIIFANPVSQVGMGLFDANFVGTGIRAFNSAGVVIEPFVQSQTGPTGGSFAGYLGFKRNTADIARVEVIAAPGDLLGVDNISFSSAGAIPEPSSLLMLLVALGVVFGILRNPVCSG